MSKKLHISDDLKLPLDTVTQTLLVLGGKGMGKTNFLSVLAEELSAAGQRFSVLDPMGAELRTKGKGQTAAQTAGGADFIPKEKAQSLVLRAQQEAQAAFHGQRQRTAGALRKLMHGLSSAAETLAAAERQLGELAAGFASETGPHIEAVRPSSSLAQGRPQAKVPRTALPVVPSAEENNGQLTGPERRILNAIAWFNTLGIQAPKQVAVSFLAGYTYGGGAFYNPRGTLRRKGLVEYLGGEAICLTGEGRTWAGHTDQPLTTEELHSRVMAVLPGPETKILEVAIAAYPGAISKEECAERSGYTPDGGAFNNPCGRLRSMGLIDYPSPGLLRAEDLLFLDA